MSISLSPFTAHQYDYTIRREKWGELGLLEPNPSELPHAAYVFSELWLPAIGTLR